MDNNLAKSIPITLKDLLVKLHFLAQIDGGYKPNLFNLSLVDGNSWYGAILRFWKGENRKSTIQWLEKLIEETIEAINLYTKSNYLSLLLLRLSEARKGITAMKKTYDSDKHTLSQINVILDNIDIQLLKHQHLLPNIKPDYHDHDIFLPTKSMSAPERSPFIESTD